MKLKVRYDSSVDDTVHGVQMDNLQHFCNLVPPPPPLPAVWLNANCSPKSNCNPWEVQMCNR